MSAISDLEKRLSYTFRDKSLLEQALSHASLQRAGVDNERLEFLGDRVLGVAIAAMLYRSFPRENEGDLAKRLNALVRRESLALVAERLGLPDSLRAAQGTMNDAMIADALEAVIGAVYLDGGHAAAEEMIARFFAEQLSSNKRPPEDPKSKLQEWAQSRGFGLPVYEVVRQDGAAHAPVFEVRVSVDTLGAAVAAAPNKRTAEKQAAILLLKKAELTA